MIYLRRGSVPFAMAHRRRPLDESTTMTHTVPFGHILQISSNGKSHADKMGIYRKTDQAPVVQNACRDIYQNSSGGYLYYWEDHWQLGPDYRVSHFAKSE